MTVSFPRESPGPRGASVAVLPWRGDDVELLRRLQADPDVGAALFYDRFSGMVDGLVWRLLGADADHEDMVQQVFLKLLSNVRLLREADSLRGWVQSVTVNHVRSEFRKRSVRRLFALSAARAPRPYLDGAARVEERDLLWRLYRELDAMPGAERLAFSLRHIEQKSLVETAELCECSLATVKRRLSKAQRRLSAFCARYPELAERMSRAEREVDDE